MPTADPLASFRAACSFEVSLRFEVFYALQVLTDPSARIHRAWAERAAGRLSKRFHHAFAELGGSPYVWTIAADVLDPEDLPRTVEALVAHLRAIAPETVRQRFLLGLLHDPAVVRDIIDGADVQKALTKIPKAKREWFAFMGLFPYEPDAPLALAIERVLRTPETFRAHLVAALQDFWATSFAETWREALPALRRSMAEKERLFESCTLTEFARLALLRVEIDEPAATLRAIRGGYRLRLGEIERCHLLPSMFNDRRHWAGYERGQRGTVVHFPYFDPSLSIDVQAPPSPSEPEIDLQLVFRALGDATRFALVTLLAQAPQTSTDLARALSISKPNMSHHLHELREAGLVREQKAEGRNVEISLRRDILERLSAVTVAQLFENPRAVRPGRLKKTRSSS
jgi:DNA-binding transcriptional ArsR family regulator